MLPPAVVAPERAEAAAQAPEPSPTRTKKPILRGWSHTVALVAAIAIAPIIIVVAPPGVPKAVISIYAGATIGLFGCSSLLHRFYWPPWLETWIRKLDHSMIFIAIAATYTPIAVLLLPPHDTKLILAVVWLGALLGIVTRVTWLDAPTWFVAVPYIAVGWAGILVIDDIFVNGGVAGFVLILSGGLLYTIGAIFFAIKRPNPSPKWFGFHEVWHLFVIAAAAVHYVAVAFVALPKA